MILQGVSRIGWIVFVALLTSASAFAGPVRVGADRLGESPYRELLAGKRVGVLAHWASKTRDGQSVVDVLRAQLGAELKMIFAPEHGFRSEQDNPLPDSTDPVTGLPVYSLYGPRQAPTPEMLAELDVVVADLQDVGLRYYTYPATLAYTMRAVARAGKRVVVLDRPNPVGGALVEGAMLDPSLITGGPTLLASIPTRHGMTLGEISRFYNETLAIGADLTVIPVEGWSRDTLWNELELSWYSPSPALMTFEQAFNYLLLSPLEGMSVAVGRGIKNDDAFRIFGAPWISAQSAQLLVKSLEALGLPGVLFQPVEWKPDRGIFLGQLCRGFRLTVLDARSVDAFATQVAVVTELQARFASSLNLDKGLQMLGASWLLDGIKSGVSAQSLSERARQDETDFLEARKRALIYP